MCVIIFVPTTKYIYFDPGFLLSLCLSAFIRCAFTSSPFFVCVFVVVVAVVVRVCDCQERAGLPGAEPEGRRAETHPQHHPGGDRRQSRLPADHQVRAKRRREVANRGLTPR